MIPLAEAAVASGSADKVHRFLDHELRNEVELRLGTVSSLAVHAGESVTAAREYTEAMLDFEVYTQRTYLAVHADPHGALGSGKN